jgi:hypothetical protein
VKFVTSLCLFLVGVHVALAQESVWDKPTPALDKPAEMTVYRSPTCGCCGKWIEHMKKHGFAIKDVQTADMDAVKRKLGVPKALESCHTAVIGGYVIEGHVPAGDVKKMLQTKAAVAGLAAPGMPAGSPGMEMGGRKDSFSVMAFDKNGKIQTFTQYSFSQ